MLFTYRITRVYIYSIFLFPTCMETVASFCNDTTPPTCNGTETPSAGTPSTPTSNVTETMSTPATGQFVYSSHDVQHETKECLFSNDSAVSTPTGNVTETTTVMVNVLRLTCQWSAVSALIYSVMRFASYSDSFCFVFSSIIDRGPIIIGGSIGAALILIIISVIVISIIVVGSVIKRKASNVH